MLKNLYCRIGLGALFSALFLAVDCRAAITIKSLDETIQISLPDGWKEEAVPPGTSEALEIIAFNERLNARLFVTVEEAGDTVISLDDYMGATLNQLKNKYSDLTHTDPKSIRINGKDAIRCEYKATENGVKIGCVMTVLKVDTHFELVDGATAVESFPRLRSALGTYAEKVKDVTAVAGAEVVVKGKDGSVQLTLPANWKQEPLPVNSSPYLQLYAQNWKLNCGVMLLSQVRADTTETLPENLQSILESFTKEYPGFTHTVPEPAKVAGHDALRCEGKITVNGEEQSYLFTSVQTETSYHQIYAFSSDLKFARLKPSLIKLISTIKELKAPAANDLAAVGGGKGIPFKGKDGTLKINLPRTWKPMEITGGGGDIQLALSNTQQDTQLFLISDNRDQLKLSLKKYTARVIEELNHTTGLDNPTNTDPESLQINGQDAMRFEFHAVDAGIKMAYLVTIIQSDKTFNQLQFRCTESRFTKSKAGWEKLAEGLKEVKAGDDDDQ